MPIRMVDDDPNDRSGDFNDDGGGRGGGGGGFSGGGWLSFLPLIFGLFRGRGKGGLLLLLVLGIGGYFLMKNGGCNIGGISSLFSQSGYRYDAKEFDKARIYEGLDEGNAKNALPEAISLLKFAPPRMNQGEQGSCVAWSSAYAAHTILESARSRQSPEALAFSPAFLYNQIGLDGCQGSYINRAMEFQSKVGAVPFNMFPYDPSDCSRNPSSQHMAEAANHKILGYNRLTTGDRLDQISVRAVKEHLAKDAPVVIGMMVGESFMQPMAGKDLWTPAAGDRSMTGMGGHAMCVIGYDDNKFGGAFQIMNSWGKEWGRDGIGWVRYGDFKTYVREAYGIDPLPKTAQVANMALECEIGLMRNDNRQYIPLKVKGGNTFETTAPIRMGTRFKMEVKNNVECHVYVLGQETDGSSYVLFPYTAKHSPYMGITGYRLFPRDQSMVPDSSGTKDFMAVVVSKQALDINAVKTALNASRRTDFAGKLSEALARLGTSNVQYGSSGKGNMYFKAQADTRVAACVVEIDKTK